MQAIIQTQEPGLRLLNRGKVRDVYEWDAQHLLIVTTDRLSAFDCVLPTPIPGRGMLLTRMACFWFDKTATLVHNHLVDPEPHRGVKDRRHLAERSVVVRRTEVLPVEAIVRGYLAGSAWTEYQKTGKVCGVPLPSGLTESARLPQPIFTPSTKAPQGQHDVNIPYAETERILGQAIAREVREASLALYAFASQYAEKRGILIADTKFEFGIADGKLVLIDEALTPDSSRFWPLAQYVPGRSQGGFDKQFVRDYLLNSGWDRTPPAPHLPCNVVRRTRDLYLKICRSLTGDAPYLPDSGPCDCYSCSAEEFANGPL